VGYTGGTSPHPTYHDLESHAEAIEVVFDPREISYEALLAVFWQSHDPSRRPSTGQYRSSLFVHSPDQRRRAEASRDALARERGIAVRTPILDTGPFHPAEDYHQKWMLRQRGGRWYTWLKKAYPDPGRFRDSTAAARLNGWFAGHGKGTAQTLARDLGLSEEEAISLAAQLGWSHGTREPRSGLSSLFGG
jgi:peptide-methionine (S)-S-oxide reductase